MKIGEDELRARTFKWLFGKNSEFWPKNMKTGMWAWVGHRLSGIALVVYVFMHLSFITTASINHKSFDDLMELTRSPLFVFMDFLLVVVVIYHAMNGFRIVLFDMGFGIKNQKTIFWICMVIAAILVVAGFYALRNNILGDFMGGG